MKKSNLLLFIIFSSILYLSNSNGAFPENTGAPDELTCGRAPCHNVAVNVGSAVMSIEYSDDMQQYLADSSYQLTVKIENPQSMKNGFQIVALDASNQNTGSWQLINPNEMKIIPGIGLPNRMYVTHQAAGNTQTEWVMDWTAPSEDVGNITFYASVNSTNNNNMPSGDQVYTSSQLISFAEPVSTTKVDSENIKVYPVPASSIVWIDLSNSVGDFEARLFSSSGKQVRFQIFSNGGIESIQVNDLSSGLYFLKLVNEAGVVHFKKILIQ